MKNPRSIVLCAMIIAFTAKGQNNNHKVYLEAQLCTGVQHNMFVSGVAGGFGVFINKNSSIDVRAKELFNFTSQNIIGPITFNYRYNFNFGLFIGAGFAHHHEVCPMSYMPHPVESMMGSERNILHRSGIDFEVGYNFPAFGKKGFFGAIYPCVDIVATQMFMDHGPNPLVTVNFGLRVGIKKFNK